MLGLEGTQRDALVLVTAIKLLLLPAYRSTDFEVHRNWLAITHHLPLAKWYFDTTSEWTLDYPPFFAYFSYALTVPLYLAPRAVRESILRLSAAPIETPGTVLYMRSTVLVSEIVLLLGLLRLSKTSASAASKTLALAIALHPGFLILDSIHFQYNGFLFGIVVWSLVGAKEGRPILCAACFAALLMFKHIYIYLAPAWFFYLLRAYILPPPSTSGTSASGSFSARLTSASVPNLLAIGGTVLGVFALALGPVVATGGGAQLVARLFPFTRGLMHAYWAPNAWAGVAMMDRALLYASRFLPFLSRSISRDAIESTSRGLVGDTSFAILPDIKPGHCFAITALMQILAMTELWRNPSYTAFLRAIAHCGYASFMFGWHVHEKAIMLVLVPLSLLATEDTNHYRAFLVASFSGVYSLFPLLFKSAETPVKIVYSMVWLILVTGSAARQSSRPTSASRIERLETFYLCGFALLQVFTSLAQPHLLPASLRAKYTFLPLLLTSVYCSAGIWWSWARLALASVRAGAADGAVLEHVPADKVKSR